MRPWSKDAVMPTLPAADPRAGDAHKRTRIALSKALVVLVAVYFVASLAHFAHNAEYIAFYPAMPAWLTREKVYLAWLAVTGVGAAGFVLVRLGSHALGLVLVSAYGALGLDGLGHYALALCSEHTLATNATIVAEAASGFVLMLAAAMAATRRITTRG
jgi:hypothetical protein